MSFPNKRWTAEEVERLKELWSGGLVSAAVIAKTLGRKRNGVLGKLHRLNLLGDGDKADRPYKQTAKPKPKPKPKPRAWSTGGGRPIKKTPPKAVNWQEVMRKGETGPPPRNILVTELKPNECAYPTKTEGTMHYFCGAGALAGHPYCARHLMKVDDSYRKQVYRGEA